MIICCSTSNAFWGTRAQNLGNYNAKLTSIYEVLNLCSTSNAFWGTRAQNPGNDNAKLTSIFEVTCWGLFGVCCVASRWGPVTFCALSVSEAVVFIRFGEADPFETAVGASLFL